MTSTIRVLLAEDQSMVREALAALLGLEDDIEVVAQVARGDEVLGAVAAHDVDVALLDIEMPGCTGIEAAARVSRSTSTSTRPSGSFSRRPSARRSGSPRVPLSRSRKPLVAVSIGPSVRACAGVMPNCTVPRSRQPRRSAGFITGCMTDPPNPCICVSLKVSADWSCSADACQHARSVRGAWKVIHRQWVIFI
ncbi:response regulator [Streptomyces sp. LaBMicrA B280]|uniref:response regulator n=1 Tax=Streptomyces sp. LaBMicrA B280 TaxID=3391001 RepID=UPI003BA73480